MSHRSEWSSARGRHDGPERWPGTGPLASSPDGQTLFSGGADHLVGAGRHGRLTEEKLKPGVPVGGLGAVVFSPDGTRLAVSDAALSESEHHRQGRTGALAVAEDQDRRLGAAVAFSPDGRRSSAATDPGHHGRSARQAYELADPARRWTPPPTFAPDGQTLASSGDDHKAADGAREAFNRRDGS